jgi:hypothetical protein
MTKAQLKEHLVKDHDMMFSLKKPKRAKKAGEEGDDEGVEKVEDEDGGQSIARKKYERYFTATTTEEGRQPRMR